MNITKNSLFKSWTHPQIPQDTAGDTQDCHQHSHIGQGGTEVFVDVGLQHSIEMLELDVPDQRNDKDLPEGKQIQTEQKTQRKKQPKQKIQRESGAQSCTVTQSSL